MKAAIWICISLLGFYLTSCATSLRKELSEIRAGMDKGQVVEKVGSPHRKRRWKGEDEWTYIYYVNNKQAATEIRFQNGVVTSVTETDPKNQGTTSPEDARSFDDYKRRIDERGEQKAKGFQDLDPETTPPAAE